MIQSNNALVQEKKIYSLNPFGSTRDVIIWLGVVVFSVGIVTLIGFFFILCSHPIHAQNGDVQKLEAALKMQSDAWITAIVTKNREAIATNMAENFLMIDMDGQKIDKQSFINNLTSTDWQWGS